MAIPVNGSLQNRSPYSNDYYYCQPDSAIPWATIADAHAGIPDAYKATTKKFAIGSDQIEYWYKGGTTLAHLVPVVDVSNKANLVNGTVPSSELPPVYFEGLLGSGTISDPYIFDGGSAEAYLKSLPGYVEGTEKILYGGGASGFSWGDVPSGGNTQLGNTVLTIGTPATTSIPLSWVAVADATAYQVERATNSGFTGSVVVYTGSATSTTDNGLTASTLYYYRVRATAPNFISGNWATGSATTAPASNITPPAPTNGIVDDTANTFDWTNSTGYASISEYEYTFNGGTSWTQATVKPLAVGNVARTIGQVGIRVKAATGRNPSTGLFNQTAFTVSGSVDLGTPVTTTQYLNGVEIINTNDYHLTALPSNGGNVAFNMSLAQGVSGWMSQQYTGFVESGETSTAAMSFGIGLDPHYGGNDSLIFVYGTNTGSLVGSYNLGTAFADSNKIIVNSIIRGRFDATTCYLEYSNDEGVTYTTLYSFARPSGTIRVKLALGGDRRFARNVRQSGFTA